MLSLSLHDATGLFSQAQLPLRRVRPATTSHGEHACTTARNPTRRELEPGRLADHRACQRFETRELYEAAGAVRAARLGGSGLLTQTPILSRGVSLLHLPGDEGKRWRQGREAREGGKGGQQGRVARTETQTWAPLPDFVKHPVNAAASLHGVKFTPPPMQTPRPPLN